MILDKPIDPAKIQALTDEQKMELAKRVYAEFLSIMHEITEEQQLLLDETLKQLEGEEIDDIRATIKQLSV